MKKGFFGRGNMQHRVSTFKRKAETEMKKQTILISKKFAQQVKVYASQHDTSISDVASKALEQYLAKEEGE